MTSTTPEMPQATPQPEAHDPLKEALALFRRVAEQPDYANRPRAWLEGVLGEVLAAGFMAVNLALQNRAALTLAEGRLDVMTSDLRHQLRKVANLESLARQLRQQISFVLEATDMVMAHYSAEAEVVPSFTSAMTGLVGPQYPTVAEWAAKRRADKFEPGSLTGVVPQRDPSLPLRTEAAMKAKPATVLPILHVHHEVGPCECHGNANPSAPSQDRR
jgi:hypothetical protein